MNESLYNQICEYKVVQFIGFVTLPIRLPLEALYITGRKLYGWLPSVSDDFSWFIYAVNAAVKDLMERTGANFCFARLHLELVKVKEDEDDDDNELGLPNTRPVSYCSAHSNPASRRSSISFEAIDQLRSYTSRNGSSHSFNDELPDSEESSPRNDNRRMSFDLTFGLSGVSCQPSGSGKIDSMETFKTLNFPNSPTEKPKIVVEVLSPTGSENPLEQSGYSSNEDGIFFATSDQKVEPELVVKQEHTEVKGQTVLTVPEVAVDGSESTVGSSCLSYDLVNPEDSIISPLKESEIMQEVTPESSEIVQAEQVTEISATV